MKKYQYFHHCIFYYKLQGINNNNNNMRYIGDSDEDSD